MSDAEELYTDPFDSPAEEVVAEEAETCADLPNDTEETDEAEDVSDREQFDDDAAGAGDAESDPPDADAADADRMAEPDQEEAGRAGSAGADDGDDGAATADGTDGAKRSRFKGWKLSELAKRPDPVWLLQNTIPAGLTVVYGQPKSGKSFWCIEIATCVAAGKPFHDATLGKSGRVLYCAAEGGGKAIFNRIMAVANKRGIAEVELEPNLEIVEHGMDLNNPKSVDEFLKQNPGHWDLVIIDTLARCMSGDENQTADMNTAVAECDRIRRKTGGDLILVHHQGWSKVRPRGASALFGALDGLIRVYRNSDRFTVVEVEALREGAVNDDNGVLYRLVDGVMERMAPQPKGVDKLRDRERKMLEALNALFTAAGGAVPIKRWRASVESVDPPMLDGTSKKVRDQQWRRAFGKLAEVEAVKVVGADAIPWLPSDDFKEEEIDEEE